MKAAIVLVYLYKTSNRSPRLLLEQVTSAPACIRDPAFIGDPASIKTLSTCHTRVINFFDI